MTRSQKDASRMRGQFTREIRDTVTAEGKLRARWVMKACKGDEGGMSVKEIEEECEEAGKGKCGSSCDRVEGEESTAGSCDWMARSSRCTCHMEDGRWCGS